MARPLRIEFPHAIYHVTSLGHARQRIVTTDADRQAWLRVLGQVVGRFSWLCHAHCLMDHHCHLLSETPQANLSRGMRQLNGVYTLRQVCFPPSRLNAPVSRGDCTISRRTVMNNAGYGW